MKLTKTQKEVIRKMRNGYKAYRHILTKEGEAIELYHPSTLTGLIKKRLIVGGNELHLTEFSKTIEL